jgi:hypothetical protein
MRAWRASHQIAPFVAVRGRYAKTTRTSLGSAGAGRDDACHCGSAGLPCLACNSCDDDHWPEMPPGYRILIDEDSQTN